MSYIPHTDAERQQMLAAIGVTTIEDLFDAVPSAHRFPALDMPPALSEMDLAAELTALVVAAQNVQLYVVEAHAKVLGPGRAAHDQTRSNAGSQQLPRVRPGRAATGGAGQVDALGAVVVPNVTGQAISARYVGALLAPERL